MLHRDINVIDIAQFRLTAKAESPFLELFQPKLLDVLVRRLNHKCWTQHTVGGREIGKGRGRTWRRRMEARLSTKSRVATWSRKWSPPFLMQRSKSYIKHKRQSRQQAS
jgi:hypothetical protein